MSDPVDAVMKALRAAADDTAAEPLIKLASVTDANPVFGLLVRFDGETLASTKRYLSTASNETTNDRVVMLRCGSTWVSLGKLTTQVALAYTNLTLLNSWTNLGGAGNALVSFMRLGGVTYVSGILSAGGVGGAAFATLPAGARPFRTGRFICAASAGFGLIRVETSGNMTIDIGSSAWYDLSGIIFPIGN